MKGTREKNVSSYFMSVLHQFKRVQVVCTCVKTSTVLDPSSLYHLCVQVHSEGRELLFNNRKGGKGKGFLPFVGATQTSIDE